MPIPRHTQVAVIGGGIGGLAVAFGLALRGIDTQLLEARDRVGGNIRSVARDGYLVEWGPNGFLDNEPATIRLVEALQLATRLQRASPAYDRRWIVRDGRIRALPASPPRFLFSDILSLSGRLRVLAEWTRPAKHDDRDESVFDFATRRIGREAAEVLVDAMVTGVFAGDSQRLSLRAAFPKMYAMEHEHGGLVRAMIARALRARAVASPQAKSGPMGPGGRLTSFDGGVETLVTSLRNRLGERVQLNAPVHKLHRVDTRWRLETAGFTLDAQHVVVACPSWQAAPLFASLDPALETELGSIAAAPIAVVGLGFAEQDVSQVQRGFGILIPGREQLPILGALFDSWVFGDRAPANKVLWRMMIGGARQPNALDETDDQLIARSRIALEQLLGVRAAPEMSLVVRHARGIPQYVVGHLERMHRIDSRISALTGLHLAGSAYHGIAMNACIKHAEELVALIGNKV